MLKSLQVRLQQYLNQELSDVQVGFRKVRGTGDQIANVCWIIEKEREFQKNICFWFIDYMEGFDCVDHNKLWKSWKRWEYQTTLRISSETCRQAKMQQLEPYMEQLTDSKLGKEYSRLYIVTLFICKLHHTKCQAGWVTSWNQDCQEKCQQPQICKWHYSNGRNQRGTKEPLDEGTRG